MVANRSCAERCSRKFQNWCIETHANLGAQTKFPRPVTRKLVAQQDTFSPIQERKSVREAWFWCFVDRVVALGGGIGWWHWAVALGGAVSHGVCQQSEPTE
jgi:hypothetical protein